MRRKPEPEARDRRVVPPGLPSAPPAFGDVERHRPSRALRLILEPRHPAGELAGRHPAADLHCHLVGAEGPYGSPPTAATFAPTLRVVVGEEGGSLLHRCLRRAAGLAGGGPSPCEGGRTQPARRPGGGCRCSGPTLPPGELERRWVARAWLGSRRRCGPPRSPPRRSPQDRSPISANPISANPIDDHRCPRAVPHCPHRGCARLRRPALPRLLRPPRLHRSLGPPGPLPAGEGSSGGARTPRAQCPKRAGTGRPRPGTAPQSSRYQAFNRPGSP